MRCVYVCTRLKNTTSSLFQQQRLVSNKPTSSSIWVEEKNATRGLGLAQLDPECVIKSKTNSNECEIPS